MNDLCFKRLHRKKQFISVYYMAKYTEGTLKECGLHSQSNYTDEDYDIKQYCKVIADADQQAHAVIPSR
jgi:hypothetical protein